MMQFIRKHKIGSIAVLISLVCLIVITTVFGRYIYNIVGEYILETKEFYFNSNVLTVNNKQYRINNWDGVNSYTLTIELNNRKNALKKTTADISYDISVNCSSGVSCTSTEENGIIYENSESDSYQIVMVPTRRFEPGESVTITTTATSNYPYVKSLSATYRITVVENDFTYNIEDERNSTIFVLNAINSLTFYQVEQAFGTHNVGDIISLDAYQELGATDKDKLFSAIVKISFDPNVVYLDMTNKSYLHRISGSEEYKTINGHQYVSGYSFKMKPTSSEKIVFYKADMEKNYTYPIVNDKSVIKVDVNLAG